MKRLLFSILLLGTLPFAMSAAVDDTFNEGVFTYKVLTESPAATVSIKGNDNTISGALVIPSSVEHAGITYQVTKIESNGFLNYVKIASVYIPATISSMAGMAFLGCTKLTTVNIHPLSQLTKLNNSVFSGCTKLELITIPSQISEYNSGVFQNCTNLKHIHVCNSVKPTSIYPSAFNGIDLSNVILHVLSSSASDSYATADYFKEMNIQVTPLEVAEDVNNATTLETYNGLLADVALTRTIKAESYNSICLPFAVSAAEVTRVFGDDCDIEELTATEVTASSLTLNFTQRTAMEAGKPYLIQPQATVTNPTFQNVRIVNSAETVSVDDVDFAGVFSPTTLAADEHILFLGANNTLSPSLGGDISGLRAYFVLTTEGARKAAAKGIKPNFRQPAQPTELPLTNDLPDSVLPVKRLENGRIVLIRGGFIYTLQGQLLGEEVRR